MYFEKTWNEKIHTNTAIAFKNVYIFFSNAHIFFPTKIETKTLFKTRKNKTLLKPTSYHILCFLYFIISFFFVIIINHRFTKRRDYKKFKVEVTFFFSIELMLSLMWMNGTVYICVTNFYAFFSGFHSSLHEILVIFQSLQNCSYWIKILYTKFIMDPFVRFGRPSCHSNSSQLHLRYVKLFFGLEKNKKLSK